MQELPMFRGYTVDAKQREFRRVVFGRRIAFVPFESPKGRRLLHAMRDADAHAGQDLFTMLKAEEEDILCVALDLQGQIDTLIMQLQQCDHPLKEERIAHLRKLRDALA